MKLNMKILTVAVPAYNMDWCLEKNLNIYCENRLEDDLEVLVIDNDSSDGTLSIANKFADAYPKIFKTVTKNNHGYGSSINLAINMAQGIYFRVVDADDWVDSNALIELIQKLKCCQADIVQTDFLTFNLLNGTTERIMAGNVVYDTVLSLSQSLWTQRLPSLHSTTFSTALLRKNDVHLQEDTFFVDEELMVIPFFYAKSICYFKEPVYYYLIGNSEQSTSPKNRAAFYAHRERVLQRLMILYEHNSICKDNRAYCFLRISKGLKDHLTTLYMYINDRRLGRHLAKKFVRDIKTNHSKFYPCLGSKKALLHIMNICNISLEQYLSIKKLLIRN
jgi:glycosyltransferase involved in cell wall biosynthesis